MNLRYLAANLITKNVVASVLSSMLKQRGQCDRNRSYATRESSTNNEIEIGRSLLTLLLTVKFGSGHLITANKVYVLRFKGSFLNLPVSIDTLQTVVIFCENKEVKNLTPFFKVQIKIEERS